jgi:DNA-binding ferritin-like protein
MDKILCGILCEFKKAEYKIHVLHTSLQWEAFIAYHPFFWEIYSFLWEQMDSIMEDMEQLWFNVPVSMKAILEDKEDKWEDKWEDKDTVIELSSQTPNIKEQLQLVENTLITLKDILQEGILESGKQWDYVVQNNIIELQKKIRLFERKTRRAMWNK